MPNRSVSIRVVFDFLRVTSHYLSVSAHFFVVFCVMHILCTGNKWLNDLEAFLEADINKIVLKKIKI